MSVTIYQLTQHHTPEEFNFFSTVVSILNQRITSTFTFFSKLQKLIT